MYQLRRYRMGLATKIIYPYKNILILSKRFLPKLRRVIPGSLDITCYNYEITVHLEISAFGFCLHRELKTVHRDVMCIEHGCVGGKNGLIIFKCWQKSTDTI